ncbi:hypothetical protein ACVW1A_001324 [Bradyrhizobium sp. LB1.3]
MAKAHGPRHDPNEWRGPPHGRTGAAQPTVAVLQPDEQIRIDIHLRSPRELEALFTGVHDPVGEFILMLAQEHAAANAPNVTVRAQGRVEHRFGDTTRHFAFAIDDVTVQPLADAV